MGGGASGAVLATHLLRAAASPLILKILEPRAALGLGVAYSTSVSSHLLNVRAGDMSVFRDTPEHFVKWLQSNVRADAASNTFASRARYGLYLQSTLADAIRQARSNAIVDHVRAEAVRLSPSSDGYEIATDTGGVICADRVVLALGNPPSGSRMLPEDIPVANAWSPDALHGLAPDATVLLMGSGLTAVDVCLSLNEAGHTGAIYAVSRRGLLPRAHAQKPARAAFKREDFPETSVLALTTRIHRLVRDDLKSGEPWQRTIAGLRPFTQDIWRTLPVEEKRRFLRHARPWWDVHRHRMAPEVHQTIEAMRTRGQLRVIAGRIVSASAGDGVTNVRVSLRGGVGETILAAASLINCIGPEADSRRIEIPLLRNLIADGLARYDSLFLGIDTTNAGALIDRSGAISGGIFAIGPILKAMLWETIAMPEISAQAGSLARRLLASNRSSRRPR
jgi:uncharacterized NAD(P)/FAD-binding protein YdhS